MGRVETQCQGQVARCGRPWHSHLVPCRCVSEPDPGPAPERVGVYNCDGRAQGLAQFRLAVMPEWSGTSSDSLAGARRFFDFDVTAPSPLASVFLNWG